MAVKPSAITGAGTEASPYVIHNYDELKWCCEDADAVPEGQVISDYTYVKLANDMDCSTYGMNFRWYISCMHAIDFNMNNKTIQNFYIQPNLYMFLVAAVASKLCIHDGKILNVYGDWVYGSTCIVYPGSSNIETITFKNVSMSIDVSNFSNQILTATSHGYKLTMTNCTIDLKGYSNGKGNIMNLGYGCKFYTCDIHLDITTDQRALYIFYGGTSIMGYALNCRVMGQVQLTGFSSTSYCVYYATIRNCVFDVQVAPSTTSTVTASFAYGAGQSSLNYGIYNTEKLPNYSFTGTNYIACTTADMDMRVNPNADVVLQEKGFDVIKG